MTASEATRASLQQRRRDELDGRVVLVTGGGRGLGEAICSVLGGAGATVVVADVRHDTAASVAQHVTDGGGHAEAVRFDVTDADQVRETLGSVIERHGGLDAVVNNAGVDVTRPVEELGIDEFDRVIDVNLRGPFIVARHAMPHLAERRGHMVNIVSTAAKRAWANASAYHASKWGLLGLSHALHVEGRERGVRVTAVVAGGMRTPFLLDRFPDIDVDTLQDPRNVANAVAFALTQPDGTVVPELTVIPMRETSWP